jgi:phospholipid:diacylglycerol acyltransferase
MRALRKDDTTTNIAISAGREEVVTGMDFVHTATDCRERHREKSNRLSEVRTVGAILAKLLFAAIALYVIGAMQKQRFEDFNAAVLERVNTILPRINQSIDTITHLMASESERKIVGLSLAKQGAEAKHSIVIVPGFVSSGLEVWTGRACAKGFFRQRIWAAFTGARAFVMERDCWKEHMMLDPFTGGDPEGIRVRASEGFGAADYFLGNYWVWGKLIENLAVVGYSPSNMAMQAYDWRLPFPLLEQRDGYFTTLKCRIEAMHQSSGRKIALITHSMGALVVHYFFHWVTRSAKLGGGGGGKDWVDKHIGFYFCIAGPHLGVPKAATALLSGEMSDTVFGGRVAALVEGFFGRQMRRDLWASWGSLWSMLPTGGNELWGPGVDFCVQRSAQDKHCPQDAGSLSPLIGMTDTYERNELTDLDSDPRGAGRARSPNKLVERQVHLVDDIIAFLVQFGNGRGPTSYNSRLHSLSGRGQSSRWHDATRIPLPHAPSMTIFCLYGTGLQTERAYLYKRNWNENGDFPQLTEPAVILDPISDEALGVRNGIRYSDGDGSVPLLSLGYVCVDAWKRQESGLNPSKTKVYTREYMHQSQFSADDPMRGGPLASDHVDILGNAAMMEDIIRIVTDFEVETVTADHLVSDIRKIAKNVNSHRMGGLRKKSLLLFRWTSSFVNTARSLLEVAPNLAKRAARQGARFGALIWQRIRIMVRRYTN